MSRPRLVPAVALTALLLALAPAATLAQQGPAKVAPAPDSSAVNLDFSGGTAQDYIAALRKAAPSANIVVLGELSRIKMAAVQLKSVDVQSALGVLDQLPQDQGSFIAKVNVSNVASSQDVPDVYAVTAEIRDRGAGPGAMQTTVISMADVLGPNLKPADALTAIETALGLIKDGGETAQIKFHEETGLLIARGTPEQIETIRQVNTQLRERAGTLEVRAERATIEQRNAEQAKSASEGNAKAREQNEALTRQVTEYRTKAEILEREVQQLQRQLTDMQDQLRTAKAERDQLSRALAESKAKEPKP